MRMRTSGCHRERPICAVSESQIDLLRRWIDAGARWDQHWAYRPLIRPREPQEIDGSQLPIRNPIDAFVQHELAEHGNEALDRGPAQTLIRRLSLDLTGLPPTPSRSTRSSPTIGRTPTSGWSTDCSTSPPMGSGWPGIGSMRHGTPTPTATKATANGRCGRGATGSCDAFNDNMPYDQFTIWQLAGDLLPERRTEQKLATGFCRNHMINGEGGRIAEENRVEYVMDMTETMGTVWLGLTLNCCRCHDHKYDPMTNAEYYQLFAFFNQTPVTGGGGDPQTPPVLATPSPSQAGEAFGLDQETRSRRRKQHSVDFPKNPRRIRRTPLWLLPRATATGC